MDWSAQQYTRFEQERTRPVRDLVAALPAQGVRRVADLGCGPGNSTQVLAERYANASVLGIDHCADMIAAARKRLPALPFEVADIATWAPAQPFDVILANASLQWLADHDTLFPRLVDGLTTGGSLAVQTPDNLDEPSHRLMRAIAAEGPWAGRLAQVSVPERHPARWYYELLSSRCQRVDVWRTTYFHPLAGGAAEVVEWFKGSALQVYLSPLSEEEQAAFLERYQTAIAAAYPALPDGSVLLPFPRLFVVARR